MDKRSAQKLVQDTLEKSFNEENFTYLVKNLLNNVEEKSFTCKGKYIFDDFKDSISVVKRVGKYEDRDDKLLDILIVHLKEGTSLERARTKQRNYVAKYLRYGRGEKLKDAALVAFVAHNADDWRFSFIKMEYKFDNVDGKTKIKEEFTPARRHSFLVGKNESSHTTQSRLLPLLIEDKKDPTLAELEDAFSIEPVTREFFERYRELFNILKEGLEDIVSQNMEVKSEFTKKEVGSGDFAKKLLGQIVFLYFLQKKGWFGVARGAEWGSGSKHFLRELFGKKHSDYKNFFNDILEPLFYQALRHDRSPDDDYFSQFDCKIPFLNGGLFDPINGYDWINIDILIPDELFSNTRRTEEGEIGNGVMDIFDRHNFTVKEDEALEKEVAVDPEMLGKVFENLLQVKDRKSKGTYYTPREIVHYMCRESLANYLATELDGKISKEDIETLLQHGEAVVEHDGRVARKGKSKTYAYKLPKSVREHASLIDDKLGSIRICDPAVGSGAFPVGMMNEIVRVRNALTNYIDEKSERVPYHFKRHAIEKCLYGVDIDASAVEIAKLRLWLSLIVDEDERETIQPLPNLDYKIVRGDALMNVKKDLTNGFLFEELEKLKSQFFNETNAQTKQVCKDKIEKLIDNMTDGRKQFDFEVYFSEIFHEKQGFDVVIANPPYGFRNVMSAKEKKYFRKERKITFPSGDIAELFVTISHSDLVRKSGTQTFIIPKKSLYGESWKNVRALWMSSKLLYLMDASKAFEKVLLEQVSFSIEKNNAQSEVSIGALNRKDDRIRVFGKFQMKDIFTDGLRNAQIYRGMYAKQLMQNIAALSISDTSSLIQGKMGVSNITSDLTLQAKGNYPCVKGIDIVKYGLKRDRYLKGSVAKKYRAMHQSSKIIAQKIVAHVEKPYPRIVITMCYDDSKRLVHDTCVEIKVLDPILSEKFVLAYFQSNFCNWYAYNLIYNRAIRTMDFINYYITQIPIPTRIVENRNEQKPFIDMVDKILAITKADDYLQDPAKQEKVRGYERQIDQRVYRLYDLSDDEISIVEDREAQ